MGGLLRLFEDIRIGPGIIQGTVKSYRKLRNTLRWMLGTLGPLRPQETVAVKVMPELERLMLHRLAQLDVQIREAYAEYDYKRVVSLLTQFMNTDLSAFYFDIRKDALYCEPISSIKRKAALETIEQIFRCACVWLAPLMCFTAEEAWLARYPSETASVHVETFPKLPASWRDDALAEEWEQIKRVRRVVTGALEIERANKRIGSSLEAAPQVVHRRRRAGDRAGGHRLRRGVHHVGRGDRVGRGAGWRVQAAGCGQRWRRAEGGAGHEVRALVAYHDRCRQRSGLPRAVGARCRGRARVRRAEGRRAVMGMAGSWRFASPSRRRRASP